MVKKVFVDAEGFFSGLCPHCRALTRQEASAFPRQKGPVALSCPSCGKTYEVEIEFRKAVRRPVLLEGTCTPSARPGERQRITVKDLSLDGCRFESLTGYPFRIGETVEIEFILDDPKRTRIKKTAFIHRISDTLIGCRFQETPGAVDPDLGFYLR